MQFHTLIEQQNDTVTRFVTILEREQAILTAAPIDREQLSKVTDDKTACAAKLEKLDQARRDMQAQQGYGTDRAGAEQLAQASDCLPQWQALVAAVDKARSRNEVNGMVIGQRLEFNEQALSLLNNASGGGLYGPDGQTSNAGKHFHHSV